MHDGVRLEEALSQTGSSVQQEARSAAAAISPDHETKDAARRVVDDADALFMARRTACSTRRPTQPKR